MRTDNKTLAEAMMVLSREIYCEDGIATAAIREAGERIFELEACSESINQFQNYAIEQGFDFADYEGIFEVFKNHIVNLHEMVKTAERRTAERICKRLEEVWNEGPEVSGDILSFYGEEE